MGKKRLILFCILIVAIIPLIGYSYKVNAEDVSGYEITGYDVTLTVNEDNSIYVTEKIEVYFSDDRHGITRKIPLKNNIFRVDGTTSKNNAKITVVKVSDQYEIYEDTLYKVIKIGDSEKTITGKKSYEIQYIYDIGKDPCENYDELYFNLIGNAWDTEIKNVSYKIVMPKSFDETKLGFAWGYIGSRKSDGFDYTIEDNTITGTYNGTLSSGEGITVRLKLPEGYFVRMGNFDFELILLIGLPIVLLGISILLWNMFGKNDKLVEPVELYPPKSMNSVEVGLMYKGKVEDREVMSLLVYLANKGYIQIIDSKMDGQYRIIKLKEYDGNNVCEEMFFNGLFTRKIDVNNIPLDFHGDFNRDEVTRYDLEDSFYGAVYSIKKYLNSKENQNKIIEPSSKIAQIFIAIIILVTMFIIELNPVRDGVGVEAILESVFVPFFSLGAIFYCVFNKVDVILKIMFMGPAILFTGFIYINSLAPGLEHNSRNLVVFIVGMICVLIMMYFCITMKKRTAYGSMMLGRIKGFKKFLEMVEKPKLEELVMEDPEYFYNILPYTYVLDVSDKWIKKFESISMREPNWYAGYSEYDNFDIYEFSEFVHSTMELSMSAPSSSSGDYGSSSDSSGGSSGGGFSGGGSGGGGGGSW